MYKNELSATQRYQFSNDTDIFNTRPERKVECYKKVNPVRSAKNRERYRNKIIRPTNPHESQNNKYLTINKNNKDELSSTAPKILRFIKYRQDLVKDCLTIKNPDNKNNDNFNTNINTRKNYISTKKLKKSARESQIKNTYNYSYNDLINTYNSNKTKSLKDHITLGNDKFKLLSEYGHMQEYAKRVMTERENRPAKSIKQSRKASYHELFENSANKENNYLDNCKSARKTKYNLLKSNIFFDKNKEKFNQTLEDKMDISLRKKKIPPKNSTSNNNKTNTNKKKNNRRRRTDIHAFDEHFLTVDNKSSLLDNNFYKNNNTSENENIINQMSKKIIEGNFPSEYSTIQNCKKASVEPEKFEILGIDNKFDMIGLKKEFTKKGLHVFGATINDNYFDGQNKGKFSFNIRKNEGDVNFEKKINEVKKELVKKKGIVLTKINDDFNKKKDNGIFPTNPKIKIKRPGTPRRVKNKK